MNFFKRQLALASLLCCVGTASAAIPNHDDPVTFLGPTISAKYTSLFNVNSAWSVLGEAGLKNFRISGTWGWQLDVNQRAKISGEYLWQDITYPFFSGNTDQWVSQGALGVMYEYQLLCTSWNPSLSLSGFISHAPSESLSTVSGTYINAAGGLTSFTNTRRIAGSNAAGIAPGVTVYPWIGTAVGLELNYDSVRYDTKYTSNHDAIGFGGTAHLDQVISDDIVLHLSGAWRQPFNNYQASLDWMNINYCGRWTFDINGAYTQGKNTLPSTWNLGLGASYFIDAAPVVHYNNVSGIPTNSDFVGWVSKPAVYIPQVLAIPDEDVVTSCTLPIIVGALPDQTVSDGVVTVDTSAVFSSPDALTYSITVPPLEVGNSVTIDPTTGVVTITASNNETETVVITATNSCGSASVPMTITFED